MEKEFVPYELSVKLKELGFDQKCFGWYNELKDLIIISDVTLHYLQKQPTLAPLWQQAFEWFMVKHNSVVSFNWHTKGSLIDGEFVFKEEITTRKDLINWAYEIDYFGSKFERPLSNESDAGEWGFETYEQARLACLEKLIELVTNK